MELHLWKEGTFMRAYDWSAWLACRYLHDFKANKRQFKDIGDAVAYIGFPETSLGKCPFRRICNPAEVNISIYNADNVLKCKCAWMCFGIANAYIHSGVALQ